MRNSGNEDKNVAGSREEDLAELFSLADDSPFKHACELGRVEFVLAVHEDLAMRQQRKQAHEVGPAAYELDATFRPAAHGVTASDTSGIDEGRPSRAATKRRQTVGFGRESRAAASVGKRSTGSLHAKLALDLRRKYEKGASIRALAEQTGRSYGFVHRVLSETGVTLRGRGGATRAKKS